VRQAGRWCDAATWLLGRRGKLMLVTCALH
jgi:hypothetical protein